jgi:MFS family permease
VDHARGGILRVLKHRDFRFLLGGYAVSSTGDWLYGVALAVYVFDQTQSAAWVAAAAMGRLLPLMLFSPLGGAVADRYDRRGMMIASDLVRAAIMFALAAVAAVSGPAAVAIGLSAASSLGTTVNAPALAAITPAVVGEEDLAAGNSIMSTVENVALAAGPALGGILLLLGSPTTAFAINGGTFLVSAANLSAIRRAPGMKAAPSEDRLGARATQGFRTIFSSADLSVLIGTIVVASLVYGHENVLFVLVSEDRLGTGSGGVGFLFAGVGVGGILAAGLSSRLARSPHPGRVLGISMTLPGLALASLAFVTVPWVAYLLVSLDGAGSIVIDVIAMTMLQRLVDRAVLARVFGALMSLAVAGTLLGSLLAPVLLRAVGLRGALLIAGALPLAMLILAVPRLRALSERAVAQGAEVADTVAVFAGLSLFEGAQRQSLEILARTLTKQRASAGETVIREGEPADALYVVRSGELDVVARRGENQEESVVNRMEAGDYFGEIGLIQKTPRTATVRALTDCELLRIPGDDFLAVINQTPGMSATLLDGIVGRLARTAPSA